MIGLISRIASGAKMMLLGQGPDDPTVKGAYEAKTKLLDLVYPYFEDTGRAKR